MSAAHPDPGRRPELRAADSDRERVIERLRAAQAEGRLDIHEFDERVAAVWQAKTYGELEPLTADLPPEPARPAPVPGRRDPEPASGGRSVSRAAVSAWLTASLVNLVIWAIVTVSTGAWIYPWWVWVAGPWGAVLLAGWLASRRRG
ncbi:MAG TPA: DUF1707 domain-containing protein [Pseudonocardia sp.]|nr:DUF1707 domain-containing protein [Pseudonocardia sp.]